MANDSLERLKNIANQGRATVPAESAPLVLDSKQMVFEVDPEVKTKSEGEAQGFITEAVSDSNRPALTSDESANLVMNRMDRLRERVTQNDASVPAVNTTAGTSETSISKKEDDKPEDKERTNESLSQKEKEFPEDEDFTIVKSEETKPGATIHSDESAEVSVAIATKEETTKTVFEMEAEALPTMTKNSVVTQEDKDNEERVPEVMPKFVAETIEMERKAAIIGDPGEEAVKNIKAALTQIEQENSSRKEEVISTNGKLEELLSGRLLPTYHVPIEIIDNYEKMNSCIMEQDIKIVRIGTETHISLTAKSIGKIQSRMAEARNNILDKIAEIDSEIEAGEQQVRNLKAKKQAVAEDSNKLMTNYNFLTGLKEKLA